LSNAYRDYIAAGRTPPEIFPDRMTHDAPPSPTMSLDAYLDRQWSGLFDREFTVEQVTPAQSGKPSRLVVLEYYTGQACSGCWVHDIGFQALSRRYPTDQILTLAWHGHPPLVGRGGTHDWWQRYFDWYPGGEYVSRNKSIPRANGISRQSLLSPSGDSLEERTVVDGHNIPRERESWSKPGPESVYRRAVTQIDRELSRVPDIALQLDVHTQNDSVNVRVRLDSLRGAHKNLALRIVLVEDTVWKRGGNDRRIYTNVVQWAADGDCLALGTRLTGPLPKIIPYTFDLAVVQAARTEEWNEGFGKDLDSTRLPNLSWRVEYPDPRDWQMDRTRLHVVAFVQDLDTGDVLQAIRMKVPIVAALQ
jgi:hypothetical protein